MIEIKNCVQMYVKYNHVLAAFCFVIIKTALRIAAKRYDVSSVEIPALLSNATPAAPLSDAKRYDVSLKYVHCLATLYLHYSSCNASSDWLSR
jgi:hypothetical protein